MQIKPKINKTKSKQNPMSSELFSNKTSKELKKFERESDGIVVFNSLGKNALTLQKIDRSFVLYADQITSHHIGECPGLFTFSSNDICKLFNFLAEIIKENPKVYNLDMEALVTNNELKNQKK